MALTEDVKQQIQQAYRDVLAGKDIRARYGQRLMIAEIARYMGEITDNDGQRTSPPATCVVEAGTGTGRRYRYRRRREARGGGKGEAVRLVARAVRRRREAAASSPA